MSSTLSIDDSEIKANAAPGMEAVASPSQFAPYRLTVDRYEAMVAAGVFGSKEPIFLWKGRLVEKMTKGSRHCVALSLLNRLLSRLEPIGYHVRQEQPIRLRDDSMPEPDLAFARGQIRDFTSQSPTANQVAMLIEIADSSLLDDSGEVLEAYAVGSIPVYWIVNIPDRRVEVHTGPSGPAESPSYGDRRYYGKGEVVPVVLDGKEVGRVAVDDVLP